MIPLNINDILGKINELRAVFVLGQRAVPFLEEVFYFLKEITPLMDDINVSIRESTRSMPRATSQLQSVSQATELATTEILDLIDFVLNRVSQTRAVGTQSTVHLDAIGRVDTRMIRLLRSELAGKDDALLSQLELLHEEKKALRRNVATAVRDEVPALDEIREKMNRIMLSLQVQDITSQQIAAVNHMIESVRERMTRLMERLTTGQLDLTPSEITTIPLPGTFDPNARYDRSGSRQSAANQIIDAFNSGGTLPEDGGAGDGTGTAQADIDALFSGASTPITGSPAAQSDIDALFAAPSRPALSTQSDIDALFQPASPAVREPSSQQDIDALFSGAGDGKVASQDDIDRLFGNG